ncbi:MAG: EAL domain-containing protein [Nitrospina sp.]|nr:EAL domain-containing protein [Nitrospina sp.]
MTPELDTELLSEIELFHNLPTEELEALLECLQVVSLEKEDILFEEGDLEDVFYVVLTGQIVVFKENKNIALRGPGEYFGEIALLDSSPRSANAKAMLPSTLLKIGRESFETLIRSNPGFSQSLLRTLAERTRKDIAALNTSYKKLKDQKKFASNLNRILDDSTNEIYAFDAGGLQLNKMNKRAQDNLGYVSYEVLDLTALDILQDLTREELDFLIQPLLDKKQSLAVYEGRHRRKSGETYPVDIRFQLMETDKGESVVALAQDISERVSLQDKIQRLAYVDDLTELPNRNSLLETIQDRLEDQNAEPEGFALFHIDLDHFKGINDSLGEEGGDALLCEVRDRLQKEFPRTVSLYRLRGDEFVLMIPAIETQDHATRSANKIMGVMAPMFHISSYDIHMTCSIGIAFYPADGRKALTLLKKTNKALTKAKSSGKNRICFYDESLEPQALEKLTLVSGLKKGLENGEFVVFYQPKVDTRTKKIIGAEALIRWNHPVKGLVSPGQFIPVAEESRLIIPIGEWVLKEACRQLKIWQDGGKAALTLSVNFSGHQFHQKNAVQMVRDIVRDSGCPVGNLELELTESVLMDNARQAMQELAELKALGIRLSIDDFGTGFSSMKYLKDMPIDVLKVDRCFIQQLEIGTNQAIVKSIVNLAQMLKLGTVVEGVETPEQERLLELIGCDYLQGYLYSKPVPLAEFEALIQGQNGTGPGDGQM